MSTRSLIELVRGFARHPEGFAGIFRRMGYVPLLPLLEFPHREVQDGLEQAFHDSGLSHEDFQSLSLRDLVALALSSDSTYWAGLAVRWLADGFPIDDVVIRAGDEMVQAKRATQADRHTVLRLIRRWERQRDEHGV
jgi:hypothetical protein